ncbi:Hypothetical predicted protein [Olea europaea subsp. europaea]|uniref:Uncharacterized protein n=1 Tax=Olea europaea subsp. europaea TaxID=158383 RepID=A0A8S0SCR3_OLEEU|nr:Hypothetical predicted protein [Olea europaea subsp. europaea]
MIVFHRTILTCLHPFPPPFWPEHRLTTTPTSSFLLSANSSQDSPNNPSTSLRLPTIQKPLKTSISQTSQEPKNPLKNFIHSKSTPTTPPSDTLRNKLCGPTVEQDAMNTVEFNGIEFHGGLLTVKIDDGRRMKAKTEGRARWVEGKEGNGDEYKSKWHEEREGSTREFRKDLETHPENWQAVVRMFERIKK